MSYKEYTFSELATIKYGKNQKKVVSDSGSIPIYGTGGLMGYAKEALYSKPSVLIGRKGTIEKVRYVTHPFWTVDTLFYTIINEEIIRPRYLYYLFLTIDLKKYNEGTTIPSLRTETLNRIKFFVPSLDVQDRALSILGALDDKIELNQRINENLEQQAQALFDNFFLNPKEIPDDWQKGSLLDIADYLNGLAMQKFRPLDCEIGLPVLKIRELRQGICDASSELCSPNIKSKYIVSDGDVIFSWSGSLLVDFWCGGTCGLNQHLFKVTSSQYDKWFYYIWTKYHLAKFITLASDMATTMGHIKREELSKSEVLIPNKTDYEYISGILQPIYNKIIINRIENVRLSNLRETLLPRLMSGKLDVSNLDM